MSDAPERIYLQLGDPSHMQQDEVDKYPGSWDVSWCDERIWSNDIEYIRAAILPRASQPNWDEAPEWAQWHGIEPDTLGYWMAYEPIAALGCWYTGCERALKSGYYTLPIGIDWRITLQRRPEADDE